MPNFASALFSSDWIADTLCKHQGLLLCGVVLHKHCMQKSGDYCCCAFICKCIVSPQMAVCRSLQSLFGHGTVADFGDLIWHL